jgi:hypothetical protein
MSFGSIVPGVSRVYLNEFRGARTSVGWGVTSMQVPTDATPSVGRPQIVQGVSPDVSAGVAKSWGAVESGVPQVNNLWRYRAFDGGFDLLSRPFGVVVSPEVPVGGSPEGPPNHPTLGSNFVGASDDFSHVIFHSSRRLLAEAPEAFDRQEVAYLYEWADGHLQLVNQLPEEEGGAFEPFATLGYDMPFGLSSGYPGQYAVSRDGGRVFFSAGSKDDSGRELYVREQDAQAVGGRRSVHVSVSERTDCAGDPTCGGDGIGDPAPDAASMAAQFQQASADSSGPALFASPKKLTDDATAVDSGGPGPGIGADLCGFFRCDLYLWDPAAAEGHRLTDLTAGPGGGGVLATVGGSDDASRVYFVATGVLAAGGAVDGQPNLYLWQQGEGVRFIARLDGTLDGDDVAADHGIWGRALPVGGGTADPAQKSAGTHSFGGGVRVTRDGRYLVFRSRAQLTSYDTAGHYQLYRYDAVTGSLVCVSCNLLRAQSASDGFLKLETIDVIRPTWTSRNVSAGGDVVFDTAEALVAGDINGAIDVYEWSGGQVRLISNGTQDPDSIFLDASESGRDVFFTTRAQLVEADQDNLVDLYDARVGGNPEWGKVPPNTSCVGDACQGVVSAAPTFAQPGSQATPRRGATKTSRKAGAKTKKCKKGTVKKRVRGKVRCVKKSRGAIPRNLRGRGQ